MKSFSDMLIEHCDQLIYKKLAPEGTDFDQFKMGMKVELEHKDVTHGNREMTAKIVLAHLKEKPDYYTRLKKAEGD